jgi:DNA-binding transcriptional regulator LsrR (DeoR family)
MPRYFTFFGGFAVCFSVGPPRSNSTLLLFRNSSPAIETKQINHDPLVGETFLYFKTKFQQEAAEAALRTRNTMLPHFKIKQVK